MFYIFIKYNKYFAHKINESKLDLFKWFNLILRLASSIVIQIYLASTMTAKRKCKNAFSKLKYFVLFFIYTVNNFVYKIEW